MPHGSETLDDDQAETGDIRVLDTERHSLVYFTQMEDKVAGDLAGSTYVIRLPAGLTAPARKAGARGEYRLHCDATT
jgi:hypothetical protein